MIDPTRGCKVFVKASGCERWTLESAEVVRGFMRDVTELCEMRPLGDPVVYQVGPQGPITSKVDVGVTALQGWMESACVAHTYPEHGLLHLDADSCKAFRIGQVVEFTKAVFGAKTVRVTDLSRLLRGDPLPPATVRQKAAVLNAYKKLQAAAPNCQEAIALMMEFMLV